MYGISGRGAPLCWGVRRSSVAALGLWDVQGAGVRSGQPALCATVIAVNWGAPLPYRPGSVSISRRRGQGDGQCDTRAGRSGARLRRPPRHHIACGAKHRGRLDPLCRDCTGRPRRGGHEPRGRPRSRGLVAPIYIAVYDAGIACVRTAVWAIGTFVPGNDDRRRAVQGFGAPRALWNAAFVRWQAPHDHRRIGALVGIRSQKAFISTFRRLVGSSR